LITILKKVIKSNQSKNATIRINTEKLMLCAGVLFTDEILEKILTREDVSKVPLVYQSAMIHAIKEVLEEENVSDAKSEYGI
jgi:hypothetical protein